MVKEIKIGGRSIPMRCDGATPYRFKQIHGQDLFFLLSGGTELGDAAASELTERLGYVMAVQAVETLDPGMCGEESFLRWLADFGPGEVAKHAVEIIGLWSAASRGTSRSKKKDAEKPSGS